MSDADLAYSARLSVLAKPRTYRLTADALLVFAADGTSEAAVRYAEIAGVRLSYEPTRFEWHRFICTVTDRTGREWRIGGELHRDPQTHQDGGEDYRLFVAGLCLRTAAANPAARFERGQRTAWLLIWNSVLGVLLIGAVGFQFATGRHDVRLWLAATLALVALPLLWMTHRRNRPGIFDPRAIPAELLPRG